MVEILIVEDDRQIANLIKVNLKDAGYKCTCAYDCIEAGDLVERQYFDLVLLDIMLPGISGYELFDYIREKEIPVIFLTAKAQVKDIVKGLKMGAEDYLTKPFEIIELLARVETVLRRYHKQDTVVRFQDVTVDLSSRVVKKGVKIVNLTSKEYELLLLFVRNKNVALFRDRIYESVWKEEYMGNSRTVDLHVQRLRKKLNWEDQITAVYKVGYRLEDRK
ncbi:response regulator transcription factor [Lachnoclostridium sp. An181]|uniref:response regulator transcription factor n=1 Tax=Lachnoclostridium sp. An181 TaxID=1965575 RepID=UPI000B3870EC|nr:response regulator transcription factor [Lachnoclostridium sp. An181]OUP51235.1 DNA-binding response regulator [Lachnoclostridium sp. An181]